MPHCSGARDTQAAWALGRDSPHDIMWFRYHGPCYELAIVTADCFPHCILPLCCAAGDPTIPDDFGYAHGAELADVARDAAALLPAQYGVLGAGASD